MQSEVGQDRVGLVGQGGLVPFPGQRSFVTFPGWACQRPPRLVKIGEARQVPCHTERLEREKRQGVAAMAGQGWPRCLHMIGGTHLCPCGHDEAEGPGWVPGGWLGVLTPTCLEMALSRHGQRVSVLGLCVGEGVWEWSVVSASVSSSVSASHKYPREW